jgi:hypothetical protein
VNVAAAARFRFHGMTSSHSRVSAYWKRGVEAHHEDID